MAGRLKNKRIIITGAATGIGRAAAEAFAGEGARVVIGDIKEAGGRAAAQALGDACDYLFCDLTAEDSVSRFIGEASDLMGGIDVLVNNAGQQYAGLVEEFDVARWDSLMAVNVRAHFLTSKYAVPHLRRGNGPAIINVASLAGKRGARAATAYSASKGAVIAFSVALALELAPHIRVNCICPGWVDTPFNQPMIDAVGGREALDRIVKAIVPLGRQAIPPEIAPLLVYLASDESSYMTAQSIVIDGGVYN